MSFPAQHGQHLQFTVSGVKLRFTRSYSSRQLIALPVGIAELGIPGVVDPPPPAKIPTSCQSDLLSMDGQPVWLSVSGSSSTALAGNGLKVSLCGPDAAGLQLAAGTHVLEAANGHTTGLNLDELALDSAVSATALVAPTHATSVPKAHVTSQSATTIHVQLKGITASTAPFHLVLGESINKGWTATIAGGPSLGAPEMIDGFANGWIVNPRTVAGEIHNGTLTLTLRWGPQQAVWAALLVSGAGLAAALIIGFSPFHVRRRRRRSSAFTDSAGATLVSPLTYTPARTRARPRVVVVTALVPAVTMAIVTRPWIGLVVGAATAGAMWVTGARRLLTAGAVGLMIAAGAIVVVDQTTHPVAAGGTWAPTFSTAAELAWAAVALLAADAFVELRRADDPPDEAPPA